jgi:sn-glycerol 3-phosphate transport system substrate-binding protein
VSRSGSRGEEIELSKVVIDVWVPDNTFPGWMDRWYKYGAEFEKVHPEYTVKVTATSFWNAPLEVAQAAAQGNPPAVSELYFYMGQSARDMTKQDGSPLFTSLERAIDGRTEISGEAVVTNDVIAPFRDYFSYQGELFSMPSVGTTSVLFANTGLLEAAGVTRLPETWDEVTAVCETLAGAKNGPRYPITWANHGMFFQQALATQGGQLVNNDNGRAGRATKIDLASKEMLTWVEWWRQLHLDGHYLHTGAIPGWMEGFAPFAEQQTAIRISSSNDINYTLRAAEGAGFDIAVGIFPFNDHVPYAGNGVAGTSLWLTQGLDKATEDGALAFTQFLHNPRNAADRHKDNSFIPITQASFDLLESEGWFAEHPYHRVPSDHIHRVPSGATPAQGGGLKSRGAVFGDFAGAQDVMTRAVQDVLETDVDPADRFAAATNEAQRLLDDYNAWATGPGPRDPDAAPHSSLKVEHYAGAVAGKDYGGKDLERIVQKD